MTKRKWLALVYEKQVQIKQQILTTLHMLPKQKGSTHIIVLFDSGMVATLVNVNNEDTLVYALMSQEATVRMLAELCYPIDVDVNILDCIDVQKNVDYIYSQLRSQLEEEVTLEERQ